MAQYRVKWLKGEIKASYGLLFFTPEYNRSVPGAPKNASDHASRPACAPGPFIGGTGPTIKQPYLHNIRGTPVCPLRVSRRHSSMSGMGRSTKAVTLSTARQNILAAVDEPIRRMGGEAHRTSIDAREMSSRLLRKMRADE